jgi:LPXTG-motif cell wall-anchored protein
VTLGGTGFGLGPVGAGGTHELLNIDGSTAGLLTAGSARVTFGTETIDALADGTYPLVVTFVDGKGTGNSRGSSVANSEIRIARGGTGEGGPGEVGPGGGIAAPQTGDTMNLVLWLVLMAAALVALIAVAMLRRRRIGAEK